MKTVGKLLMRKAGPPPGSVAALSSLVVGLMIALLLAAPWHPTGAARLVGSLPALLPTYHQAQSSAAAPRPTPTIVSSYDLPHVAGKKVTTVLVEFPPGGFSPEHHHAGSVSVYVLSGTIESQLGGGPVEVFKPGEMFFEPPGAVHMFARNTSTTEPARILAIFVHDDGATLTTYH